MASRKADSIVIDLTDSSSPPPPPLIQKQAGVNSKKLGSAQPPLVQTQGNVPITTSQNTNSTIQGCSTDNKIDPANLQQNPSLIPNKQTSQPEAASGASTGIRGEKLEASTPPPAKKAHLQREGRIKLFLKKRFPIPDDIKKIEAILHVRKTRPEGEMQCYVKYHNLSYRFCEWIPKESILDESLVVETKKRIDTNAFTRNYTELYNPEYVNPESILAKMGVMYLVKWNGLSYGQSTWESGNEAFPRLERLITRYDTPERERIPRNKLTESQNMAIDDIMYRLVGKKNFVLSIETVPKVENIFQVLSAFQDAKQLYAGEKKRFLVLTNSLDSVKVWEKIALEKTWLNCVVYHGSDDDLSIIRELLLFPSTSSADLDEAPFDLLVMTQKTFVENFEYFSVVKWCCAIIDNALMYKVDRFCDQLFMMLNTKGINSDSFGIMVDLGSNFVKMAEANRSCVNFMLLNDNAKESIPSMLILSKPVACNHINIAISKYTDLQMDTLKKIYRFRNNLNTEELIREMEKCTICPLMLDRDAELSDADAIESSGMLSSFRLIFDKIDKTQPGSIAVFSKYKIILYVLAKYLKERKIPTKTVTVYEASEVAKSLPDKEVVLLCNTTGAVLNPFKELNLKTAIFFDLPSPFSDMFCFANKNISVWYVLLQNSYSKKMYDHLKSRFGYFFISLNAFFSVDWTNFTESEIDYLYLISNIHLLLFIYLTLFFYYRIGKEMLEEKRLPQIDANGGSQGTTLPSTPLKYAASVVMGKALTEPQKEQQSIEPPQMQSIVVTPKSQAVTEPPKIQLPGTELNTKLPQIQHMNPQPTTEPPITAQEAQVIATQQKVQLNTEYPEAPPQMTGMKTQSSIVTQNFSGKIQLNSQISQSPGQSGDTFPNVIANFGSFVQFLNIEKLREPPKKGLAGPLSKERKHRKKNDNDTLNENQQQKNLAQQSESMESMESTRLTGSMEIIQPSETTLLTQQSESMESSETTKLTQQSESMETVQPSEQVKSTQPTLTDTLNESDSKMLAESESESEGILTVDQSFYVGNDNPDIIKPRVLRDYLSNFGWGRFGYIKTKYSIRETKHNLELGSAEVLLYALTKIGIDTSAYISVLFQESNIKCGMSPSLIDEYYKKHSGAIKKCKAIGDCFKSYAQTRIFLNSLFVATKLHRMDSSHSVDLLPKFKVPWWDAQTYAAVIKEIDANGLGDFDRVIEDPKFTEPQRKKETGRFDVMRVLGSIVVGKVKGEPWRWTRDSFKVITDYIRHSGLRKYSKDKTHYATTAIIDTHLVGVVSTEMVINLIDKSIVKGEPNSDLEGINGSGFVDNCLVEDKYLLGLLEFMEFYVDIKKLCEEPQRFKRFTEKLSYPLKGFPWWNDLRYDVFILCYIAKSGFLRLAWHACKKPSSPFRGNITLKSKVNKSFSWELYSNLFKLKVFPGVNRLYKRYKAALSSLDNDESFGDIIFAKNPEDAPPPKQNSVVINRLNRNKNGLVTFPIYGSFDFAIERIGKIEIGNENYYSENYIFPVGYRSVRLIINNFAEMKRFVCTIERGESGPEFVVAGDDCKYTGQTPTEPWKQALRECGFYDSLIAEQIGYELYGLNDPSVTYLIQKLPYVCACTGYKHKDIVEEPEIR